LATIGLKIITMWRSSMTRAAGWRVGDYRKAWRGSTRLHALIAQFVPERWAVLEPGEVASRVKVGIETDRGQWVQALIAAGYEVFAINPMSVARYRERHPTSGARSDAGDAHVLAEIVRLDRAHHRPVAGDSERRCCVGGSERCAG
jgi:transposase